MSAIRAARSWSWLPILAIATLLASSFPVVAQETTVEVTDTGAVRDGNFEASAASTAWRFAGAGDDKYRATDLVEGTGVARLCGEPSCDERLSQQFAPPPASSGSLVLAFQLRVASDKVSGDSCQDNLLIEIAVGNGPGDGIGRSCDEAESEDFTEVRVDISAEAETARRSNAMLEIGFVGQTDATSETTEFVIDDAVLLREDRSPGPPNIRVSSGAFSGYNEPHVAIDPADPRRLVGAAKAFTDNDRYRFRVATFSSGDGGQTWTDHGVLPGLEAFGLMSDPVVAFGPEGVVYVMVLGAPIVEEDALGRWGVFVYRSADGGRSYAGPSPVDVARFDDKPWIAVDTSQGPHRGAVYVVWTRQCQTFISRSVDGRAAFTPSRRLNDGCAGAQVAVSADGTVNVVTTTYSFSGESIQLDGLVSGDGGATFEAGPAIATVPATSDTIDGEIRAPVLPMLAVAADTGDLFLAWSDPSAGNLDVWFTRSIDAGDTFSEPVRLNDAVAGDQFQPAVAAGPGGEVVVSWFDRSSDPENRLAELVLVRSTDGGASFGPTERVSSQRFDPALAAPFDGNRRRFFGDYQGLVLGSGVAIPFWNDPRSGLQQIYTAHIPLTDAPVATPVATSPTVRS